MTALGASTSREQAHQSFKYLICSNAEGRNQPSPQGAERLRKCLGCRCEQPTCEELLQMHSVDVRQALEALYGSQREGFRSSLSRGLDQAYRGASIKPIEGPRSIVVRRALRPQNNPGMRLGFRVQVFSRCSQLLLRCPPTRSLA